MTTTSFSSFSVQQRRWLAAAAILPLLVLIVARMAGVLGLVKLGAAGLVGAAFLATVFLRPRWGVYFMAFYVYSALFFYVPAVLSIAVVATLALAALLELFAGGRDQVTDPVFWGCLAALVMLSLHSSLVAYYPDLSAKVILTMVKAIALTLLVVHFVRSADDLRRLAAAVFVGAIATIVFGVINLKLGIYAGDNVIRGAGVFRFSGTHNDPNEAAAFMCSAIPLGVYLFRYARTRWARILAMVGVVVLVVGVFATFSRSAIFAFAVVVIAVVAREVRSRGGYLSILGGLAIALLFAPGYYWVRLLELREVVSSNLNQDFSVVLRLEAMVTAWKLFLEHPWAGIGLGNFEQRGAIAVVSRIVVHNTYLEVLASLGIMGLLAYLGVFVSGLRHCVTGARDSRQSPDMRALSYYLGLSMVSIMVSATFLSILFKYPLWIPLGATLVLGNLLRRQP